MITPVYANLIGVLVECILYGIYIPLFVGTGFVLHKRRTQGGRLNVLFTIVTILLFLVATLHIAGSMQLIFESFIFTTPGQGPAIEDQGHPLNQYRKVLDTIAILIGDGLVIYRCYAIWNRDLRVIALPIVLLILTTVAGRVCAFIFTKPGVDILLDPDLQVWVPLFFGSSFATNLLITSLTVYRLLMDGKKNSPSGASNPYWRTIAIIIESGAIYLVGSASVLILFSTHSAATGIPANILTPLIGIAPTLIILQVQSGLSQAKEKTTTGHTPYDSAAGQSMAHTLPVHYSHSERSSMVMLPIQTYTSAVGGPITPPAKGHSDFLKPDDGLYFRPK